MSLNGLTWAKTLMVCAILVCGGIAAYLGANVTMNFNFESRLSNLENRVDIPLNSTVSAFVKEANYIVSPHESYYCLFNGTDDRAGRLEFFSTNKTLVQQFAVGNLTAGGMIFLKDNTLDHTLTCDSNIRIVESYQGTLTQYRNSSVIDCPVSTNGTFLLQNSTDEQTLLEFVPIGLEEIDNVYLDLSALTQNCTIRVYLKVDGVNYQECTAMRLGNISSADRYALALKTLTISSPLKITITSLVFENATRTIPYRYITTIW